MEVSLTDEHELYAWRLGLTYGAWHPAPQDELTALAKGLADYCNAPLNEVTSAYGRWYYRQSHDDFTEDQVHALRPYLAELTQTAGYAFEASIYYRRAMVQEHGMDPRVPEPDELEITAFASGLNRFLDSNPNLQFYFRARVDAPDPGARTSDGPPRPSAPAPQPYGVSHAGAEHLVAAWMRHLGALDAQPTRVSGDGGIDVISSRWIAQVKNLAEGTAVPVAHIRDLAGVAHVDGRKAALFTSGAYSAGGIEFADRAGIALFRYDAVRGQLSSLNNHAAHARAVGMGA